MHLIFCFCLLYPGSFCDACSVVQLIACFWIGSVEKYGSSPESESMDDSQMRRLLNIDFDSLVKYGVM